MIKKKFLGTRKTNKAFGGSEEDDEEDNGEIKGEREEWIGKKKREVRIRLESKAGCLSGWLDVFLTGCLSGWLAGHLSLVG